jgi:hypothetical protein
MQLAAEQFLAFLVECRYRLKTRKLPWGKLAFAAVLMATGRPGRD